jgi:hypothetical protein
MNTTATLAFLASPIAAETTLRIGHIGAVSRQCHAPRDTEPRHQPRLLEHGADTRRRCAVPEEHASIGPLAPRDRLCGQTGRTSRGLRHSSTASDTARSVAVAKPANTRARLIPTCMVRVPSTTPSRVASATRAGLGKRTALTTLAIAAACHNVTAQAASRAARSPVRVTQPRCG